MSWGLLVGSASVVALSVWGLRKDSDIAEASDAERELSKTEDLFEDAAECKGDHITVFDETGSAIRRGRVYRVRKHCIVLDVRLPTRTVGDSVTFPTDKPNAQDLKTWIPKSGHRFDHAINGVDAR